MRSQKVYGGLEGYIARTLLKSCGFTDEELKKPLIAVVNSWTNIVPGHVHLDRVAEAAEAGVRTAARARARAVPYNYRLRWYCNGT